jgi:hypothetical protein
MNITAALLAAGVGAAFLGLEIALPYRPNVPVVDMSALAPDHFKARAAVSRLMFYPGSAQFSEMRTVEENAARYVCGGVSGKDKAGSYSGPRAFVYTVSNDFAQVDDDGRIAAVHTGYRPCPVPEDDKAAKKLEVSPQVLALAKKALSTLPQGTGDMREDLSIMQQGLPTGISSASTTAEPPSGRRAGQLAALNTPAQTGSSAANVGPNNEGEWRRDTPPSTWPAFPSDDPLAKPAPKRTHGEAIALASSVEQRWTNLEAGRSRAKPSPVEIEEALRALLAIDRESQEFPKAWALFVRLRQIDRVATAMTAQ